VENFSLANRSLTGHGRNERPGVTYWLTRETLPNNTPKIRAVISARFSAAKSHRNTWRAGNSCDIRTFLTLLLAWPNFMNFYYFAGGSGCEVLWWVCLSVCLSVSLSVSSCVCLSVREDSPEPHERSLPNSLCMLPMSVAWSSSGMLTTGRIAYQREGADRSAQSFCRLLWIEV